MASLFGGVSAVLLPYKITLLSNSAANGLKRGRFYYPIKLHYSQTRLTCVLYLAQFYYPIKLHYSQTFHTATWAGTQFYYPIKLHYSQTDRLCIVCYN